MNDPVPNIEAGARVFAADLIPSTSAQLRAAERERDEALTSFEETYADLAQARFELKQARSDLTTEQAALAASQQDLTRMEAERDAARHEQAHAEFQLSMERARLAHARQEVRTLRARDDEGQRVARLMLKALGLDPVRVERPVMAVSELRAELDVLRASRSWQVARQDTGITCTSCSQPIVRGQAFAQLADADGHFTHCHCPDLKETP